MVYLLNHNFSFFWKSFFAICRSCILHLFFLSRNRIPNWFQSVHVSPFLKEGVWGRCQSEIFIFFVFSDSISFDAFWTSQNKEVCKLCVESRSSASHICSFFFIKKTFLEKKILKKNVLLFFSKILKFFFLFEMLKKKTWKFSKSLFEKESLGKIKTFKRNSFEKVTFLFLEEFFKILWNWGIKNFENFKNILW